MGRPKRTLLDEAATRVWFSAVSMASGLPTAYQLERYFAVPDSSTRDAAVGRSCQWDKYCRGSNTPSKRTRDRVEKEFPGTRQWLEHPIWEICSDANLTKEQLSKAVSLARPKLAKYVGQPVSLNERRYLSRSTSILSLRHQADLTALVALLALVRDGEAKRDSGQSLDAIYASAVTASLLLTRQPLRAGLRALMQHLCGKYFAVILHDRLPPFSSAEEAIHFVEILGLLISEGVKSGFISRSNRDAIALSHWAYENMDLLTTIDRPASEKDPVVIHLVNLILEDNACEGWLKKFYWTKGAPTSSPYVAQSLRLSVFRSVYGSDISTESLFKLRRENQLIPRNT